MQNKDQEILLFLNKNKESIKKFLEPIIEEMIEEKMETRKHVTEEEELLKLVTEKMRLYGVLPHLKGYEYLKEAIYMYRINGNPHITRDIYPTIAKKYNTTSLKVERSIRTAIEVLWDRGNIELLQKDFGYIISPKKGRPTNLQFISVFVDNMKAMQ